MTDITRGVSPPSPRSAPTGPAPATPEAPAPGQALDDPDRLAAVRAVLAGRPDGDAALEHLVRLATHVAHAPVALVSLVDDIGQRFVAEQGMPQQWAEGTPLTHSLCQHVVREGGPLVLDDVAASTLEGADGARRDLGVGAYAGFPLHDADGQLLGSFCVIDRGPRQWTEHERRAVADMAAAAEAALVSRAALARETERVALLVELSEALHTDLEAEATLRAVGDRVVPAFADLCIIDVVAGSLGSPGVSVISAATPELEQEISSADLVLPRYRNERSAASRVLAGEPSVVIVLDDAYTDSVADGDVAAAYRRMRMRSTVIAAVRGRAGVEGVLSLIRVEGSRPFDDADRALAEELGRRVGVALENARLYERERHTAHALQRTLLPRPSAPEGLEVAARYLPSRLAAEVGGDWYDVLTLAGGRVGVVVGDVAGHDVAAAASMGQLRAIVRTSAWEGDSPGVVVDRTCKVLRGLDDERVATLFYGLLGPAHADGSRRLEYCTAGHPPPLLLVDGTVHRLDGASNALLGIDVGRRDEAAVALPPGAVLLSYTDGLVERRGEAIDVGVDRLAAVLAAHAGSDVEQMASAVVSELLTGDPDERDDVALLVLRVPPA